jgi:hypothetical protein
MLAATDDVLAAVDRLTVLAHHHDALGDLAVLTGALAAAMPPDCIIGPAEVRQLAGGVTHRTFKLWREGQNLAGRGPVPGARARALHRPVVRSAGRERVAGTAHEGVNPTGSLASSSSGHRGCT